MCELCFADEHQVSLKNIEKTISWLMNHKEVFDSFHYDVHQQEFVVKHPAGEDVLREGMYITSQYGILLTS